MDNLRTCYRKNKLKSVFNASVHEPCQNTTIIHQQVIFDFQLYQKEKQVLLFPELLERINIPQDASCPICLVSALDAKRVERAVATTSP